MEILGDKNIINSTTVIMKGNKKYSLVLWN